MSSKQETGIGESYDAYKKMTGKAIKELDIQPYCKVSIVHTTPESKEETLYKYDLPRDMVWEYLWVIEWRKARFVCKYPKDRVRLLFHYYDRSSGLEMGYQTLVSKQISAKALITKYTNLRKEYIRIKSGELFFDPTTDETLRKFNLKIETTRKKFDELSAEIETLQLKEYCKITER